MMRSSESYRAEPKTKRIHAKAPFTGFRFRVSGTRGDRSLYETSWGPMPFPISISPQSTQRSQRLFTIVFLSVLSVLSVLSELCGELLVSFSIRPVFFGRRSASGGTPETCLLYPVKAPANLFYNPGQARKFTGIAGLEV